MLVLPIIARSVETNWSFGAAVSSTFHVKSATDSNTRTSNLQALALYSLNKQLVVAINGTIFFPGEKYILNQQISYSYFPDKFWGLGKNTLDKDEEPYNYRQFYVYLHPQRLVSKKLFLGFLYEFQKLWNVRYVSGGLFDKENVSGRYGYVVSGLGASITYDTRNNAFAPDHGIMMQFHFSHFNHIFGSGYEYTNFAIDMRKFFRIYKQQVLALQAYGFFNTGDVPLRSLAALGGANSMRGYYAGRFRDKNEAVLQAEYRIPLFWRFGCVVFSDLGNVGTHVNELDFDHLKYSYGGGIRIALSKSERLNIRLDYGIGPGTAKGFYFQLGEAF
ncbi:MAG: BamA/TamA family outer membrane protein [Bacteroidetes bacterium]|nr:BamA/TamA family outer membrane protein [Bacteroidota bacterium]